MVLTSFLFGWIVGCGFLREEGKWIFFLLGEGGGRKKEGFNKRGRRGFVFEDLKTRIRKKGGRRD